MEDREDLSSILPLLPLVHTSSSLSWPYQVVEALKALSRGPDFSSVDSGEILFLAISDIRNSLSLPLSALASSASHGFSLFFDDLVSRAESRKWFAEVLPTLATLLLRLPSLLETHYRDADGHSDVQRNNSNTGLRLLKSQEPGLVLLTQELIGALLACSFFCLFPINNRGAKYLQTINFDHLFASLHDNYNEKQENKIKCIIHYFERICSCMPKGMVSFERKVLPIQQSSLYVSYPNANFWSQSVISLCDFKVYMSGLIEDQSSEALEVDFANKYIGGGALHRGCVQEEIRFMINPELVVGMFFLPSMADNEAIEIVGTERFSNYAGYGSSFQYAGDHVDKKDFDDMGRRKTRIIAIDALCSPGKRQYGLECLLRETNKAFCGFLDQSKSQQYQKLFQDYGSCRNQFEYDAEIAIGMSIDDSLDAPSTSFKTNEGSVKNQLAGNLGDKATWCVKHQDEIGIVTGNWGCGVFGGDPELKAIIQWLAASQAMRPFISYHTFGMQELQTLKQVSEWIRSEKWNVGELWNMVVEYATQKVTGQTNLGFLTWLLPSLPPTDTIMHDAL